MFNKGPWGGANGRAGWKEYYTLGYVSCILPHLGLLHLDHLVNHPAVGAGLHGVGKREHRIKFGNKSLVAAIKVDK